jgi:hypothetical protein
MMKLIQIVFVMVMSIWVIAVSIAVNNFQGRIEALEHDGIMHRQREQMLMDYISEVDHKGDRKYPVGVIIDLDSLKSFPCYSTSVMQKGLK